MKTCYDPQSELRARWGGRKLTPPYQGEVPGVHPGSDQQLNCGAGERTAVRGQRSGASMRSSVNETGQRIGFAGGCPPAGAAFDQCFKLTRDCVEAVGTTRTVGLA